MKTTVTIRGVEFQVEFYYEPEEKQVWTYRNGDPGHPGSPAYVEIISITHKGTDFTEFFVNELEAVEHECLLTMEDDR